MTRKIILMAITATLSVGALPAQAGFFLEGLKAFTQEPRCPDPHATNKDGCAPPDTAYPEPKNPAPAQKPDVRTRTREGLAPK